jgi:hypothetical protein
MKKNSVKLEDLKLKSFVTVLEDKEKACAKGGNRWSSIWKKSSGKIRFYTILETRLSPKSQLPSFLEKFSEGPL